MGARNSVQTPKGSVDISNAKPLVVEEGERVLSHDTLAYKKIICYFENSHADCITTVLLPAGTTVIRNRTCIPTTLFHRLFKHWYIHVDEQWTVVVSNKIEVDSIIPVAIDCNYNTSERKSCSSCSSSSSSFKFTVGKLMNDKMHVFATKHEAKAEQLWIKRKK
jgi:hypothetical protein